MPAGWSARSWSALDDSNYVYHELEGANIVRKIIVLSFISLDGVMQAPGGPEEDTSGGFEYGGWSVPYFDEALGNVMAEQMAGPFALLLGRKTFEIFASYWPQHAEDWPGINEATKYVVSNTLREHELEQLGVYQRRRCRRNKKAQAGRRAAAAGPRKWQSHSDLAEA